MLIATVDARDVMVGYALFARDFKPRIEPKFEPKRDLKIETKVETPVEQKAEPKLEPAPAKAAFDNLEEEMASLLGRPPGKT